ncbi:MAG: universal stress protein [Bacteroidetes bacterium]|nr:universal stress protein [Bacteroidota bacterium]
MKQIIVGIDFSKTSLQALKYGIFLANRASADVMMIWVDNQTSSESVFSDGGAELREEAKRNFEEIMEMHKGLMEKGELSYKLRKGKVYFEIAQHARQINANLIISGTHGVSGFEEFWIGSNAYRIVTNAPCPVITIRQQFDFNCGVNNIVVPLDHTKNTVQKVPTAMELAKLWNARIHILALYSTGVHTLRMRVDKTAREIKHLFDKQKIPCICESILAENVSHSTIAYTESIKAEMIVIMTEQETTTSNILLGEYAQQMVNYSPVPVLSVHPKEIHQIIKQ